MAESHLQALVQDAAGNSQEQKANTPPKLATIPVCVFLRDWTDIIRCLPPDMFINITRVSTCFLVFMVNS